MIEQALQAFIVFGLIFGGIALVVRVAFAYFDGRDDALYPNIADGDWREGFLRSVYEIGHRAGTKRATILRARKQRTNERRGGGW